MLRWLIMVNGTPPNLPPTAEGRESGFKLRFTVVEVVVYYIEFAVCAAVGKPRRTGETLSRMDKKFSYLKTVNSF